MVGFETLPIYEYGRPATYSFLGEILNVSGPVTGRTSGTTPGQIGVWVCPEDGCQAVVCAQRPLHTTKRKRAEKKNFMAISNLSLELLMSAWRSGDQKGSDSVNGRTVVRLAMVS